MCYFDIHIHALCQVDDGPKTNEEMFSLIDAAYADGVRAICLTPHFHVGYFGDNTKKCELAFGELLDYVGKKYSDLKIMLGNELRYSEGCIPYLVTDQCKTMNQTKYVLVDFSETETERGIARGLERLLSAGYLPILAHAERYRALWGKLSFLSEYRSKGVKFQVDAQSLFGKFGFCTKRFAIQILKNRLADFVSSDAHDTHSRPPGMDKAYRYIEKKCSKNYAQAVCFETAMRLLCAQENEGEK